MKKAVQIKKHAVTGERRHPSVSPAQPEQREVEQTRLLLERQRPERKIAAPASGTVAVLQHPEQEHAIRYES